MTEARRKSLSLLMRMAWSFKREEQTRSFGDCLRGAWKCTKRIVKQAMKTIRERSGQGIRYTDDLTRSPIKRSLSGKPGASYHAYKAAYHTAIFGS